MKIKAISLCLIINAFSPQAFADETEPPTKRRSFISSLLGGCVSIAPEPEPSIKPIKPKAQPQHKKQGSPIRIDVKPSPIQSHNGRPVDRRFQYGSPPPIPSTSHGDTLSDLLTANGAILAYTSRLAQRESGGNQPQRGSGNNQPQSPTLTGVYPNAESYTQGFDSIDDISDKM